MQRKPKKSAILNMSRTFILHNNYNNSEKVGERRVQWENFQTLFFIAELKILFEN